MCRLATVDRLRDHETAAIVRIRESAAGVFCGWLTAHCGKQRVVELLRPGDVVAPDHDMAEHSVLSSSEPVPCTDGSVCRGSVHKEKISRLPPLRYGTAGQAATRVINCALRV